MFVVYLLFGFVCCFQAFHVSGQRLRRRHLTFSSGGWRAIHHTSAALGFQQCRIDPDDTSSSNHVSSSPFFRSITSLQNCHHVDTCARAARRSGVWG